MHLQNWLKRLRKPLTLVGSPNPPSLDSGSQTGFIENWKPRCTQICSCSSPHSSRNLNKLGLSSLSIRVSNEATGGRCSIGSTEQLHRWLRPAMSAFQCRRRILRHSSDWPLILALDRGSRHMRVTTPARERQDVDPREACPNPGRTTSRKSLTTWTDPGS